MMLFVSVNRLVGLHSVESRHGYMATMGSLSDLLGVHSHEGTPIVDGLFHGKSIYTWMRTGGTPMT